MSSDWHWQMRQTVRVEKSTKTIVWSRTEKSVLMVANVEDPTRETLSRAGKECVRSAVEQLFPMKKEGDVRHSPGGAPKWQSSYQDVKTFVSIAHSAHVAVGVAATYPVGVDVERSDRDVGGLLRGLMVDERELMPEWSAIEILCAKEAAGKAQQVGLAGTLKRWHVSQSCGALRVIDTESLSGNAWNVEILRRVFSGSSYSCAIATPDNFSS